MTIKMEREVQVTGREVYFLYVDEECAAAFEIKSQEDKDRAWAAYELAKENGGSIVEVLKEETI